MEKIEHNKLVRDKVPEILQKDKKIPVTEVLKWRDYIKVLEEKMIKTAQELKNTDSKRELVNKLADLQELLDAIRREHKITRARVDQKQQSQRKERGGFKKRIFLKWTEE